VEWQTPQNTNKNPSTPLPVQQGGLGLSTLDSYVRALALTRVKNLFTASSTHWVNFVIFF